MRHSRGARRRSCHEKYEAFRSAAAARLRLQAVGSEVVNGYTTPARADAMSDALALGLGDLLLDVGGGRGWPGSAIARRSGAALVVTDLPENAVRDADARLRDDPVVGGSLVARMDARALGFADGSFDGVCHADVLC